jgi:hypothetical protein
LNERKTQIVGSIKLNKIESGGCEEFHWEQILKASPAIAIKKRVLGAAEPEDGDVGHLSEGAGRNKKESLAWVSWSTKTRKSEV